jgi:hypothetical protein
MDKDSIAAAQLHNTALLKEGLPDIYQEERIHRAFER